MGERVHGIIANPPCTEFSIARSGGKPRLGEDGIRLVRHCQRIIAESSPDWWVIENPGTGALKQYLGVPTYQYQPWWYGSPWTKLTALWGNFNIPERKYWKWENVPKNEKLYVRGESKHRRSTGKPAMYQMHKSSYHLIPEFSHLPEPQNDMEFRSFCSQKFAQAFFDANP